MYKNDLPKSWKHNIGLALQSGMDSKTEPETMNNAADEYFRLCIDALDCRHDARTGQSRNGVRHGWRYAFLVSKAFRLCGKERL